MVRDRPRLTKVALAYGVAAFAFIGALSLVFSPGPYYAVGFLMGSGVTFGVIMVLFTWRKSFDR